MKDIIVLYHANCEDGFGGAWVAWKKFGKRAEYIGVDPDILPKEKFEGKKIFIIDNGYPKETLEKLLRANKSVVVLDHHVTRQKSVEAFPGNVFDNNHSGAVITWKYFFPGRKIPLLLRHIECYDLWKWKMPWTREIVSALDLIPYDFKKWSRFVRDLEKAGGRRKIVQTGAIIGAYGKKLIDMLSERATPVKFEGYRTLAVNSPILQSEIGNALVKRGAPVAIIWGERRNEIRVSLRSSGVIDVSKIAEKYGGGGHKAASGFGFPASKPFPWKPIDV